MSYTDRARTAHLVERRRRQLNATKVKRKEDRYLEWLGDRLLDRTNNNQIVARIQCDAEAHGLWRARSRAGQLSEPSDKATANRSGSSDSHCLSGNPARAETIWSCRSIRGR
jgi:hypothetical protein